jgi:hypothetical protein
MCEYPIHKSNGKQVHLASTDRCRGGRLYFVLDHPFEYKTPDGKINIIVPEGEETDGASVPFLFWIFFPPIGPWLKTAVVHDYLYKMKSCKRSLADRVFLYDRRYSPTRMILMWMALRLFGWIFYYRKCSKK